MNDMSNSNERIATRVSASVYALVALLVLLGLFMGFNWGHMPSGLGGFLAIRVTIKNLVVVAIFLAACAMTFYVLNSSKESSRPPFKKELAGIIEGCSAAGAFALIFPLISETGTFSIWIVLWFVPAAVVACSCVFLAARFWGARLSRNLSPHHDLIIVGSGPRAANIMMRIESPAYGNLRVLGFVDSPKHHSVAPEIKRQMLGSFEELDGILMRLPVDEVLIALPIKSCLTEIQTAIQSCERAGVEATFLLDIFGCSVAKAKLDHDDSISVLRLSMIQSGQRLLVKRCIDICGAVIGLVIFGLPMLVIAAAIRLTSPGPALFVQERYGFHKRRFLMYKFRTMVANADTQQGALERLNEKNGPVFKIKNDPRITPLGRLLRISSLDELPQLFNVLLGNMSLVGPRPMSVRDVLRFDDASLMRRFSVMPGITCLWQVAGRSNTEFPEWIALDLEYIDNWSLALDFQILARTVPAVLVGRGAS